MTEDVKPATNFQPQWTEGKVPKVAKLWPAASQYSKSDSQPQENHNCNKVREENQLTTVTNRKPDSAFPMMAMNLESASAGSRAKVTEATAESPKKVNPEDESKLEAKNQPMQDSQSVETTAKNSSTSSGSVGSTDNSMTSTDSGKKSVLTPTSGEGKDTKKLLDSCDKIHDIKSPSAKQQVRSVLPKNKPNSQKPDDDDSITLIDNFF